MHTAHIILVKAEDHEDAFENVWQHFNNAEDNIAQRWSDWQSVGDDSRWSMEDFVPKGTVLQHNYVLSYETETELFSYVVDNALRERQLAFEKLYDNLDLAGQSHLSAYNVEDKDLMKAYDLYRFAQFVAGYYNPDSHIVDLDSYTTNLEYFQNSIAETEPVQKNWYAVVVDLHF